VSADLFTRHIAIPMYAGMSDDDVAYVADTVRDVVSSSAVRR
jgi:hypothetical protein